MEFTQKRVSDMLTQLLEETPRYLSGECLPIDKRCYPQKKSTMNVSNAEYGLFIAQG